MTDTMLTATEISQLPTNSRSAYRAAMRIALQLEQGAYDSAERNELRDAAFAKRELIYKHDRKDFVSEEISQLRMRACSEITAAVVSASERNRANFADHCKAESKRLDAEIREANRPFAWMHR